jgi:hypothetical protein
MDKKYRKLYFIFIVVVTLVSIPLLLLHSAGYRWNWNKNKIVKTGSLYAAAIPKDAKLLINDEVRASNTPILINNLSPGEYIISYSKDGYSSWGKKLLIESKKTTFATNIILFKNSQPQEINKDDFPLPAVKEKITIENENTPIKDSSYNEDKNKLLFYNDYEIWNYNLKDKSKELITRQSEVINEAVWLTDYYVIYAEKDKIKAIELDSRDKQQTYILAEVSNPKNLSLDKKNKNLFFQTDADYWQLTLLD